MPRKPAPEKKRSFVFTLYQHPTEAEFKKFMKLFNYAYYLAGDEICPTTGRQHWQGWMHLKSGRSLKSMIGDFKGYGRVKFRKGTVEQNNKYCSKDGHVLTEGRCPKQGQRTDLEEAIKCKSIRELFEKQTPNFQTIRVCEKHLEYCEVPVFRDVQVAHIDKCDWDEYDYSCEDAYVYNNDTWHGYDGQELLIVFETGAGVHVPKTILEGIPQRVNVGGSSRQIRIDSILYVRV